MNASRLDSLELPLSTPGTLLTTPTWVYALMVVVTAALSIQLFEFVRRYAVNILFWDQWDFYDPLFEGKGWWDLFSWQHGPHRQGIGFVVTKWVLDLTAWDTVIEGYYIATLLILATGVALVIKKRLCGSLSGFDIVIPILCLTRIQYETIIITPNSSHSIFPFLLLCLLTYSLTWRNEWSKHITISLLTALLTYTGFGMFIWIVVTPLLCQLFIRYAVHRQLNGLIAATLALIIIMAAVLLFFKNYRFLPAVDNFQFPHERPLEYLLFVSLMFANFFGLKGINFISLGFGSLLLILTFGLFCKNLWYMIKEGGKIQIPDLISFVFCGFTLIYCTNVAVGRVVLGLEASQSSRYTTLLIPSLLALYLQAYLLPNVTCRKILLASSVVCVSLLCIPLNTVDSQVVKEYSARKRVWTRAYLQTESVARAEVMARFKIYPVPEDTRLDQKLKFLKERRLNLYKRYSLQ